MALAHNPRIVTDGLVLCLDAANVKSYPGSGTTWSDLSGSGNHGTLTNGPLYSSNNNGYITFDGINDFAQTQTTSSLSFTSDFSLSIFVRMKTNGSDFAWSRDNPILWKVGNSGSNDDNYGLGFSNSKFTIQLERASDGADFQRSTTNTYNLNQWYFVVANRIGANLDFYINGSLDVRESLPEFTPYTGSEGLWIGRTDPSHGSTGYAGMDVGPIQIYNRALSDTEIQQNFNALRGRYGI